MPRPPPADEPLVTAVRTALWRCRGKVHYQTVAWAVGLRVDQIIEMETTWRDWPLYLMCRLARTYGVPLQDLLPDTAWTAHPRRKWTPPDPYPTVHEIEAHVWRGMVAAFEDDEVKLLRALPTSRARTKRCRSEREVEARLLLLTARGLTVMQLQRLALVAGVSVSSWLPFELDPGYRSPSASLSSASPPDSSTASG